MDSHTNSSRNELTMVQCLASYIVETPSQSYIHNTVVACVINGMFLIIGCILNCLVIFIFLMSKELRAKMTFFPIMVLCSVDFATVVIVHPLFLTQAVAEILESPKCSYKVAYFSMLYILPGMSASILLIMNVERYIAIVRPLWYIQISKRKQKFMYACMSSWLIMVLNLACLLYKLSYSRAFLMGVIAIACFITLFIYASIFYVARKQRSSRRTEQTNADVTQETRRNKINFINELKIAKMYFLVVMLSFICYLPTAVAVFKIKYPWRKNEARRTLFIQVYTWTNTFVSINSTLNCLVFFWANARLRAEAWKLWKTYFRTEQASSHGTCVVRDYDDAIEKNNYRKHRRLSN